MRPIRARHKARRANDGQWAFGRNRHVRTCGGPGTGDHNYQIPTEGDLSTGLTLVAAAFLAIAIVMLAVDGEVVLWIFPGLPAVVFLLAAFATYVEVREGQLRIRNLGVLSTIPLARVASIEASYHGITVRDSSGRTVIGLAVQKANASSLLARRTRADRISTSLQWHVAHARRASHPPAADKE